VNRELEDEIEDLKEKLNEADKRQVFSYSKVF
jgi:hypothetical protein